MDPLVESFALPPGFHPCGRRTVKSGFTGLGFRWSRVFRGLDFTGVKDRVVAGAKSSSVSVF